MNLNCLLYSVPAPSSSESCINVVSFSPLQREINWVPIDIEERFVWPEKCYIESLAFGDWLIDWLIDWFITKLLGWRWCNILTHVCLDASCSNNAEKVLNLYQVQHWQLINSSCYDYWVFLLLVTLVCFGNTIRPAVRDLTTSSRMSRGELNNNGQSIRKSVSQHLKWQHILENHSQSALSRRTMGIHMIWKPSLLDHIDLAWDDKSNECDRFSKLSYCF